MAEYFRCQVLPSKHCMSEEMCASRLDKPDAFPECKGCLGRNQKKLKKVRKRKLKLPEMETVLDIVATEKKVRKPRAKKTTETPVVEKKPHKPRAKKVVEAPETSVAEPVKETKAKTPAKKKATTKRAKPKAKKATKTVAKKTKTKQVKAAKE